MTDKSLGQIAYEAHYETLVPSPRAVREAFWNTSEPKVRGAWQAAAEAAIHHILQRMELTPPLAAQMLDAGLDYFDRHPTLRWCPHCRSYSERSCRCYDDE